MLNLGHEFKMLVEIKVRGACWIFLGRCHLSSISIFYFQLVLSPSDLHGWCVLQYVCTWRLHAKSEPYDLDVWWGLCFLEQVHFDGHSLNTSGPIVTKLAREPNDIYVLDRLECWIGSRGFEYRMRLMFLEQVPIDRQLWDIIYFIFTKHWCMKYFVIGIDVLHMIGYWMSHRFWMLEKVVAGLNTRKYAVLTNFYGLCMTT